MNSSARFNLPERRRGQLHGRRKGPKLSAHQSGLLETLLPQLTLKIEAGRDPRAYFDSVDDVWLEVGFGGGEHLAWQAEHNPNIGMIGAEPFVNGVAKLLGKLNSLSPTGGEGKGEGVSKSAQISPPHPGRASLLLSTPQGGRGRNVRIHMGDARDIIDALPDASIGRVFILFPDPWPKTRHHKRRFIQMDMLDELARVMKPQSELRFATDDPGYLEWTLERLTAYPSFEWLAARASDWKSRTEDWPQTRYEAKQLHGVPSFLRFVRK